MKPNEAQEHTNLLEAKRAIEDAIALMARGKRTRNKRRELLFAAGEAIRTQLAAFEVEDADAALPSKVISVPDPQSNEAT